MQSVEHYIVLALAIWAVLKWTGVFDAINEERKRKQNLRSLENTAFMHVEFGTEQDLRSFVKDNRNELSHKTLKRCLEKLRDMHDEREREKRLKSFVGKPVN